MALEALSGYRPAPGCSHVLLGLCRYSFCTLYMRSCQRDAARRIEISNVPASTELLPLTIRRSHALQYLSMRFVLLGEVSAVVVSCDGPFEAMDTVRLHFLGALISCAWCTGTSGTLTSSNSSWPTALMVYQSGLGVGLAAQYCTAEGVSVSGFRTHKFPQRCRRSRGRSRHS